MPALCVLSAASAVGPAPAAAVRIETFEDTVLAVQKGSGQMLVGSNVSGRIAVEAWDRDRVELVEEDGESRLAIRVVGTRLLLAAGPGRNGRSRDGRRRASGGVTLRVPAWLPVQLRGSALSASVSGLAAAVDLSTVEGDLAFTDVRGDVSASTVEGSVTVEGARGRRQLQLRSVNESVRIARVDAESVVAQSTSGDIEMDGVSAATIDAATTDGNVTFAGELRDGGTYRLSTHDGDLTVALSPDASASVTVSTFDGEFRPEIPIAVDRFRGGKETSFTLGKGGARLTLVAFDGDIVLRRR